MAAFTRAQRRMVCLGVQLTRAQDNCDPGKFPILQNVRSYVGGELQARQGLLSKGSVSGSAIHSLIQVDDPTPFAGTTPKRYIGAGSVLYAGPSNGPWPSIDTGYSGNPLSFCTATPPQSPQPWLYVADASRQRKVNSNGTLVPIGIAAPLTAPTAVLDDLGVNVVQQFAGSVPWQSVGTVTSPIVFTSGGRINTTVSQVIYDSGTSGNCSIAPASIEGFDDGIILTLNGSERIACQEVTIAVATTTIAAILYDAGSTGLCTIQPAASLGVGQIEEPSIFAYQARSTGRPSSLGQVKGVAIPKGTAGTPQGPNTTQPVPRIRQVDFPVNALVTLGSETVRILSVALGPDGVQSFRCTTVSTHSVGEALVGVSAFRAFTLSTASAGQSLVDGSLRNTITPPPVATGATTSVAVGGVQTTGSFPAQNLALINGRSTLPGDDIHCSIRVDQLPAITAVRIYFNIDATNIDYTENYFFFEWGANDIIAAIQAQNAAGVSTLQTVRVTTVTNQQLNQAISTSSSHTAPGGGGGSGTGGAAGSGTAQTAVPANLGLGNNQWVDLRCKVSDLIQVGTDTSRTLANVNGCEIIVAVDWNQVVTIDYDALWISGGYEPDVGAVGNPYVWCARYRSSTTGAISNPSPAVLGGVVARRQQVFLNVAASGDAQADLVDWFRLGGALTTWTYVGTSPSGVQFADVYSDSAISGGQALSFENFQPWPTSDLSRAGTCNVAGSAVQWVSGPQFNTAWAPGSIIIINGRTCTLYAQPSSATRLIVNENAGSGSAVPFTMPAPTLLSQAFATWFGGAIGGATFYFSCGDTINPGYVHWTNGNDSETSSDKNTLEVTTAAEPLQNGFLYDGVPYVFSTENLYVLEPAFSSYENELTFGSQTPFRPLVTPCGRGLWTRWALAVAPEGVYFLAKDGIYLTTGGGVAVSITDADLYPLFPHDGVAAVTTNGYVPPDMTQPTKLRLAYVQGWLYFDYVDTNGASRTLRYWPVDKSWWPDVYTPGVGCRLATTGVDERVELLGGTDGTLYTMDGGATDNGTAIAAHVQFTENQGDARREKLYRDAMLDADLGGGTAVVTLGVTNNTTTLPPQTIGPSSGRGENFINSATQIGTFGLNLTVDVTWNPVAVGSPVFYLWDVAYQMTPELATSWLSGPTTHGLSGFQQVYQALIAYRSFGVVTYSLVVDGVAYSYNLPSTAGQYQKQVVILQAVKGLTFQHGMQGAAGFQLFDADCEAWIQAWSAPGGYQKLKVF